MFHKFQRCGRTRCDASLLHFSFLSNILSQKDEVTSESRYLGVMSVSTLIFLDKYGRRRSKSLSSGRLLALTIPFNLRKVQVDTLSVTGTPIGDGMTTALEGGLSVLTTSTLIPSLSFLISSGPVRTAAAARHK